MQQLTIGVPPRTKAASVVVRSQSRSEAAGT